MRHARDEVQHLTSYWNNSVVLEIKYVQSYFISQLWLFVCLFLCLFFGIVKVAVFALSPNLLFLYRIANHFQRIRTCKLLAFPPTLISDLVVLCTWRGCLQVFLAAVRWTRRKTGNLKLRAEAWASYKKNIGNWGALVPQILKSEIIRSPGLSTWFLVGCKW